MKFKMTMTVDVYFERNEGDDTSTHDLFDTIEANFDDLMLNASHENCFDPEDDYKITAWDTAFKIATLKT